MTVYIGDKLVITTLPKTIHFDLSKDIAKNVKHETDSTIEHNEFLAKHTINNKYCSNITMETIFMNTKESKQLNHTNLF